MLLTQLNITPIKTTCAEVSVKMSLIDKSLMKLGPKIKLNLGKVAVKTDKR